jgi:YD repeat-containing protein
MRTLNSLIAICCYALAILLLGVVKTFSQDPNLPKVLAPSPNAASLGIYGQIPVSYFSGRADVSVPLGDVSIGDIKIPITLSYHGGGIKPDHHAGWVGLGWNLNAGGTITRKVNGGVDEILICCEIPENQFSYYDNPSLRNDSHWADSANMSSYSDVNYQPLYPAPDEFTFNFNGYSGSFFMNHLGQWQVRSNDPIHITIQEQLANYFVLAKQNHGNQNISIRRIFYQFTLTTPDGTKYIFGGTSESIEFTRAAEHLIASDPYFTQVTPTAWNLTKVIARNGDEAVFTYERDGLNCTVSNSLVRYQYTPGENKGYIGQQTASIINTSYLKTITAPNQTVIFKRTYSNELPYDYGNLLYDALDFVDLSTNTQTDIENDTKWLKLDSISFYSNNTFLNKAAFYYRQQPTSRMFLDSVKVSGRASAVNQPYIFRYNTDPLPEYNSMKIDHWGLYNGQSYFLNNPKAPLSYTKSEVPAYYASRAHNTFFMEAGILTSIKYPTGGITKFDYEPNDYRKIAKRYPFIITDTTGNIACGGLRIKSITNTDAFGKILTTKQYYYRLNYQNGGSNSSGILAGYPQYLDEGSVGGVTYWMWFDYAIHPLSYTEGNHVTYSEVVEKSTDGSYTIYKYSNHDQGTYMDQNPVANLFESGQSWKLDPSTSRSLDRGKLLLKSDYSASNVLMKRTKYDYDTSAARYSEYVKMVKVTRQTFGTYHNSRVTAYLEYTFPRYLIKQLDTLWDDAGNNPVATIKQFKYNTTYGIKVQDSTSNSSQLVVKRTYKYPFDYSGSSDPTGVYQAMTASNIITTPVETKDSIGAVQTRLDRTNYYQPYTAIYVPQNQQMQIGNNAIETRLTYFQYDSKGNMLSSSKNADAKVSYLWDYNQMLPVCEVNNAAFSDFAYTSFESTNTGNWNTYTGTITAVSSGNFPPTGKNFYSLTTSATLVKNGLTAAKTYILSYWTQNATAFSVTGTMTGFPVAGRSIAGGWKYFEHKITGQTSIILSGTGLIDEVRIYPYDAQMKTFAYDTEVGLTSTADANNRITYFDYDGLQRLRFIRDQDRNVLKKFDYKYADKVVFYNKAASGGYQRNNCTGCLVGSNHTYYVDDSTFTSTVDQETADQIAVDYVAANGQNYANTIGTCSAPPASSLMGNNTAGFTFSVFCHNRCTGTNYSFNLPNGVSNYALGSVPAGPYDVTMSPPGGTGNYYYRINQTFTRWTGPVTITVDLSGTNQVIIAP